MRTLADFIEEHGPLPVRDAIGWTLRTSLTLWALHEEGILHGRVSPAAILVEDTSCRSDGLLIRPSQLEDAPSYQSLDRAEGEPPSKGDDLWAVGVTLYFALTGELPYPNGVIGAVQRGKVRAPPPLAVHGAELDVMQPVLDRLIRADRPDRIQAAEEIVAGLRDLSPAIADVDPLAIERAFDDSDVIQPEAPESEPPVSERDQEAWRKLTVNSLAPPRELEREQSRTMLYAFIGALAVGVLVFLLVSPKASVDTVAAPAPTAPGPTPTEPLAPPHAPDATAGPPAAASSTAGAPAPNPAATEAPHPTGSASVPVPESHPAAGNQGDIMNCTAGLLAPDAFRTERVAEDFPCRERNPAKGIQRITALLIRGSGGQATQATREWSNLGWYRAAAFAVARSQCCTGAPPLESPKIIGLCKLDPALAELGKASVSGTDDDVAQALQAFGTAANCVATAGGGAIFHQKGMPNPQQALLFLRMIGRQRTAKRKN